MAGRAARHRDWRHAQLEPAGAGAVAPAGAALLSAIAMPGDAERNAALQQSPDAGDVDGALVARLKAGDQQALSALMLRHRGRLTLIARRILGRADEAEDLVQDAFVAIWRSAARLDPARGPIGAWLTRVVVNRAIDRARRARFLQFIGLEAAPEAEDAAPDAETTAVARSEVNAVMKDLQALPPRQRAAILLAADEEQSMTAIASILDISPGATEQLLVRARRTLRLRAMERQENADRGRDQDEGKAGGR